MKQEIKLVVKIARENSSLAIQRNGRYYQNQILDSVVGDLVFAFTELQGDPTLHWKLRLKWSGPYVFLDTVVENMALIGTMLARLATTPWRAKTFTIHQTKIQFYQSQDSKDPHCEPRDLPSFNQNDWIDAEGAESTCFDDVTSVHMTRRASNQWALKPTMCNHGPHVVDPQAVEGPPSLWTQPRGELGTPGQLTRDLG